MGEYLYIRYMDFIYQICHNLDDLSLDFLDDNAKVLEERLSLILFWHIYCKLSHLSQALDNKLNPYLYDRTIKNEIFNAN